MRYVKGASREVMRSRWVEMLRPGAWALAVALTAGGCQGPEPKEHPVPGPAPERAAPVASAEPQGEPLTAELTHAPMVPPPIHRDTPARLVVNLEVREVTRPISDGVEYTFWTFGGEVPGKFIRVRQGDTVEFHLQNHPDSKMPHNIDLHAVTGPGGGATSSFTAPGHASQFTFKALNAGLYVYHCATAPVGMHVANGMYGLILVEPPGGLPPVDREYYVMQGDFYTVGKYREKGLQPFDMQKAIEENATYVLFNGSEGALVGERALQAKVGERVRLFVGNGGPNLVSSFHVIGEIFDKVYTEGGTLAQENVQTTIVPAGGSAIVEMEVQVPGTYILVDHSLFRAFNKGALGMLKVEGPDALALYSGKEVDSVYLADKAAPQEASAAVVAAVAEHGAGKLSLQAQRAAGEALFAGTCSVCHQANGQGLPGVFPPLASSDFFTGRKVEEVLGVPLNGLSGKLVVNGKEYDSVMPPMSQLNDDEIANIMTYVYNAWGNPGGQITPEQVKAVRSSTTRPPGAAL